MAEKVFGLIGYPLGHSFSQQYFQKKFQEEQISNCAYHLFPLTSIGQLPQLLHQQPNLVGLNVTIPYKQAVIPFLHHTNQLPFGACNCIAVRNGQLHGYNTDYVGFEASFSMHLKPWHTHALVLGNGGATLAVLHVLNRLGIPYTVVSRQMHQGTSITYAQLTPQLVAGHHIIINCTPLGTFPNVNEAPNIPYEAIGPKHYLYDLVYNPSQTKFLLQGKEAGATVENGANMLSIQANEAWKIWTT
ncbi:MAG: shikimate dehydrogenase [Bacteroidetes bacterium]|nr:MAG: shikimate dehydrogenase [Bacteroidota bacterium]